MARVGKKIPIYSEKDSFAKKYFSDFYIASYEDPAEAELNRAGPHRHTYYEIIWVMEGCGNHMVDFKDYPFRGPCLFLANPSHVHQIVKEGPTKGYLLKFSESFFSADPSSENLLLKYGIFDNINVQPVVHLHPATVHLLSDLMQKMLTEFEQHTDLSKTILAAYLKIFLLQVYKLKDSHREELKEKPTPGYLLFRTFKKMVEEHYTAQHSVQFYATGLALSVRTLSDIVFRYAGKTASEVIKDRLLLEAKRLIYSGHLSIKEIAAALGFDDAAYFSRFFTKNAGVSPQAFRQQEVSSPLL